MVRRVYELTWIKAKTNTRTRGGLKGYWRKRHEGRTYYLKTPANGKRDEGGYQQALVEWERLRAFLDGYGPSPYVGEGRTARLKPEHVYLAERQAYERFPLPVQPPTVQPAQRRAKPEPTEPEPIERGPTGRPIAEPIERPDTSDDPAWYKQVSITEAADETLLVRPTHSSVRLAGEKRPLTLFETYLASRKIQVDSGELSLQQWNEDRIQLEKFINWLFNNYKATSVDQIDGRILTEYRDFQRTVCKTPRTLTKRLGGVAKWFNWLLDTEALQALPRSMKGYARVKQATPQPSPFTVSEVRDIFKACPTLLRACFCLGINAGYTLIDCATLEPSHIDRQTGIVTRQRHKTKVEQRARLWPMTLSLLDEAGSFRGGPILTTGRGRPLIDRTENDKGKMTVNNPMGQAWNKHVKKALPNLQGTFKSARQTYGQEIENRDASLVPLALAHTDTRTARHYVNRSQWEELFKITDEIGRLYDLESII